MEHIITRILEHTIGKTVQIKANGQEGKVIGVWIDRHTMLEYKVEYVTPAGELKDCWLPRQELSFACTDSEREDYFLLLHRKDAQCCDVTEFTPPGTPDSRYITTDVGQTLWNVKQWLEDGTQAVNPAAAHPDPASPDKPD